LTTEAPLAPKKRRFSALDYGVFALAICSCAAPFAARLQVQAHAAAPQVAVRADIVPPIQTITENHDRARAEAAFLEGLAQQPFELLQDDVDAVEDDEGTFEVAINEVAPVANAPIAQPEPVVEPEPIQPEPVVEIPAAPSAVTLVSLLPALSNNDFLPPTDTSDSPPEKTPEIIVPRLKPTWEERQLVAEAPEKTPVPLLREAQLEKTADAASASKEETDEDVEVARAGPSDIEESLLGSPNTTNSGEIVTREISQPLVNSTEVPAVVSLETDQPANAQPGLVAELEQPNTPPIEIYIPEPVAPAAITPNSITTAPIRPVAVATAPARVAPAPVIPPQPSAPVVTQPRVAVPARPAPQPAPVAAAQFQAAPAPAKPAPAPARPPVKITNGPKIALVIAAAGLNENVTRFAIEALPAGVTLAFAPVKANVGGLAREAKADGHTVLVEIPMEPVNKNRDPGPLTLRVGDTPQDNIYRLNQALARVPVADGASSYLGARFNADARAATPIVNALSQKGLFLFENEPTSRSVFRNLSANAGLPYAQGMVKIDRGRGGSSIRDALNNLEKEAKTRGYAVGVGTALRGTISTVALWAKAAQKRGVQFVPITQVAR